MQRQTVSCSQLNACHIRKRLQVTRLSLATRASRTSQLQSGQQAKPVEFAGNVVGGVIRTRRAGAASFEGVRCEVSDYLLQTIDAGGGGTRLLGDNRCQRK